MSIIIDTDIGTDVDDAIALAYAIKTGQDIKLISTVHGNAQLRARIAKKFLNELSRPDIPVAAGEDAPLKQTHHYLTGLEGRGYIDRDRLAYRKDGIAALIETIDDNPGIEIVAIGPLTNIGRALRQEPGLEKKIGHIYVMGNAILTPDAFYLNYRSHNLKVDPEAADIVFAAGIPTTLVTTEVCKKAWLTKDELAALPPDLDYIRTSAMRWLKHIKYDVAYLYDPLVVHHVFDPGITERKTYGNIDITVGLHDGLKEFCKTALHRGP